ncbi:MAG TPA: hypothetical protein VGO11_19430 [Chthoniobacteraceae bacterium]|jgi:hypothetical protein|nr:hypothetical protein [Chthoniobacteraceae bacterium]
MSTKKAPVCVSKGCTDVQAVVYPTKGRFTYGVEGTEGGRYFTRYLHVPSASSGLTLGRGYDMKEKSAGTIKRDLTAVGVPDAQATVLSAAARLSGAHARKFITDHKLEEFSITPDQQRKLFESTYGEKVGTIKRILTKADVAKAYGKSDYEKLNPAIQEMLVDLCYRGDYTGKSRHSLQPAVVKNDLKAFRAAVAALPGVPPDRMQQRLKYLDDAVKKLPVTVPSAMAKR